MDKSTIIVTVHAAYCFIYMIILLARSHQYRDKIFKTDNNPKPPFEYYAYDIGIGILLPAMATLPFVRNFDVLNYSLPITFIAQFAVQFLILVFFLLDTKLTRYMATYSIAGFIVFMFLNGLFKMEPQYSKLELTTQEIENISKDLDGFSDDVSERIKKVNNDMNSVVLEIKERQKQIESINQLLQEKEKEYQTVRTKLEVDKEKADEILKALGVKPPTIIDRLTDAGIGAVFGLFLSIIWNRLFGKRNPVNP